MTIALRERLLDAALVDHESLSAALAAAQAAEAWVSSGAALGRGLAAVAPAGSVGRSEEPPTAPKSTPEIRLVRAMRRGPNRPYERFSKYRRLEGGSLRLPYQRTCGFPSISLPGG